ncbi:MAG: hypothetical protein B6U85_01960 [Desulfurococcales archaeon ex4484_42]|nr:MAG: hypothetical protein B6U85_01960 [Desulfurococcales archaeon ex4484_42]
MADRFVITSILVTITVIAAFYISVMILYEASLSTDITLKVNVAFTGFINNVSIEPNEIRLDIPINSSSGTFEYRKLASLEILSNTSRTITLKLKKMEVSSFNVNSLPIRLELVISDHGGLSIISIPINNLVISDYLKRTVTLDPGTYDISLIISWNNLHGLGYLDLGCMYVIEVSE